MLISMYAHVSKEHAWEVGHQHGLEGEALMLFRHAGTEHKITYEVNPATGEAEVIAIDDCKVTTQQL